MFHLSRVVTVPLERGRPYLKFDYQNIVPTHSLYIFIVGINRHC